MFLKDLIEDEISKLDRVDMVFDRYFEFTKSVTRTKQSGNQGTRYRVVGNTPLPGNWTTILKSVENKRELNEFLAKPTVETVLVGAGKICIATCNENVLVVPNVGINVDSLQPCNQEELYVTFGCDKSYQVSQAICTFNCFSCNARQLLVYYQVVSHNALYV